MSTPTVDTAPLKRQRRNRIYLQLTCVTISLFMLVPIYLISLAALSTRESLNEFPLSLIPNNISFDTLNAFLSSTGIFGALGNSIIVGIGTVLVSAVIGIPGGYALARFAFPGKDPYQLFLLFTRALPIVVLSVPLRQAVPDRQHL